MYVLILANMFAVCVHTGNTNLIFLTSYTRWIWGEEDNNSSKLYKHQPSLTPRPSYTNTHSSYYRQMGLQCKSNHVNTQPSKPVT